MMAASALASAMLKGGDSTGLRHAARSVGASLLPVDSLSATTSPKPSPAKLRRRWEVAHRCCDAILIALGLWLAGSSLLTMMGPERWHGALLGAGVTVLGGLGLVAAGRECLSLRSLMLVGLGFAALSTLELMQQVSRGVETHCALAEATTRIRHLEDRISQMRHDELITQLFFRMNEMDDMLGLVQQSATAQAEVHSAVWRAAQADRDYLRAKAAALRRHAVAVRDALSAKIAERKANASASGDGGDGGGVDLSQSLWGVERRVEAVDSVIRYIDQKDATNELTYEEYEIILEALLEGSSGHVSESTTAVLRQEKGGLDAVKAAFERHATQSYDHVLAAGGGGSSAGIGAVTRAEARKESSRRHFENRFMDLFHKHGAHHAAAFSASLSEALQSLPERCVRDVEAYSWLRLLGWLLLAAQFAGGYAALTSFVLVAKKDD